MERARRSAGSRHGRDCCRRADTLVEADFQVSQRLIGSIDVGGQVVIKAGVVFLGTVVSKPVEIDVAGARIFSTTSPRFVRS